MRTLVRSLAFVLLVLLSATSVFAQKGEFAVPQDAQLDKYPILETNKPLTVMQIADMHLHPVRLEKPTVVQNHFRGLHGREGRFVVETLPKGTLVLLDENGNLRYKEDCGNRLVEFDNQALVRGIVSSIKMREQSKPVVPYFPATSTKPQDAGIWKGVKALWNHFIDALRPVANWLGWFLGWAAIWLMIALLIATLYELAIGWGRETGYPPLPGTATRPSPNAVVQPLATVPTAQPAVAQTQVVTEPVATVPVVPVPEAAEVEPAMEASTNSNRRRLQYHPQNGNNPAMIRTNGNIVVHSVEHNDEEHVIRYRLT